MAERVRETNQISLNGVRLKTVGPVRASLASIYPPKIVVGDTTRDSQQRASVISWTDLRGGIGVERFDGASDVDRVWWATTQLRYKNHIVLPGLVTQTAESGISGTYSIGAIGELANKVYVAFGTSVRSYNNTTDSWGSSLHTLSAAATDSLTARMLDDSTYLFFAFGTGFAYSTDGSTWTNDSDDNILYMTSFEDRIWGIDSTGQLRSMKTIGNWQNHAKLPLPDDYVTDLFVGRDAEGNFALYASTKIGLWIRDPGNAQWVPTEPVLPFHDDAGKGVSRWRDAVYYPAGLGIYKYVQGQPTAVVSLVGPDRDHGLPASRRGTITQLIGTHNDLLALVDATSAPSTADSFATSGMGSHHTMTMEPDTGFSHILGWNELGWEVKWLSADATTGIDYALVSNVYSKYRMWWAHNQRIYFMSLPRDIINPSEVTDFDYGASSTLETPWFNAGQAEIEKLALRLRVETQDCSTTEAVTVYYATDYSTTWTQFTDTYSSDTTFDASDDRIEGDGVTTFHFPSATAPTGTVFRSIRFRLDHVRGSTTTVSPDVLAISFEFRKKIPAQWQHTVQVDINEEFSGRTSEQQFEALRSAVESQTKVEFTYRDRDADDSGSANPYNYYVDVVSAQGLEYTGNDWRGIVTLQLVEV